MNIIDYAKYYGDYTFKDKPFNEVDNLIFSVLSYVNYEGIVKDTKEKITINEAAKEFLKNYKPRRKEMIAIKGGIELLIAVKDTKRFGNLNMMNYIYVGDEISQFSAVTFELDKKTFYVSFEGTDSLLSGWEEDCKMAYNFPVEAQILAKNYLDKHFTMKKCNLIVGGHSKGGNLALVSSMYANYFVKKKIKKIYSNDGQGLRKAQLDSKFYEKIDNRLIHIIPNYSIVGLLLRHKDNYQVIKSNKKGFLAHDALTWQVSYDHLEQAKLSRFSKVFDEGFSKWLDKYDDEARKTFVKGIFDVFRENGIVDLMDVTIKKELITNIMKSSKEIDPLVKEMTLELIKIINKTNFEYPIF